MYLLEGLARWNKDRASAVFDQTDTVGSTTYSSFIGRAVNQLGEDVLNCCQLLPPSLALEHKGYKSFTGAWLAQVVENQDVIQSEGHKFKSSPRQMN